MKSSRKVSIILSGLVFLILAISFFAFRNNNETWSQSTTRPNIVIILSDDQGYADVSFHEHPPGVATPAIDKLAKEGIVFTNGYASAYVCAPTRAGLLTGRYQQRFGFYRAPDSRIGLPLSEKTLADYLKEEGYATGIFGKWHLGLEYDYRPLQRGFDEFYGFLGHGAHDYFDLKCDNSKKHNCIYRNNEIIHDDEGYLTDILAREACAFIKRNAVESKPFFLYLPFNAVHWPLQAPKADAATFNTGDGERDIMLGMLHRMDIAISQIQVTLKATGQYENTFIVFFSDNGGAARIHANNSPLRDYKQSTYEGGIRVPFIVSWPQNIKPGIEKEPVISLDIVPTVFDVLGKEMPQDLIFDGKSIMPVITGYLDKPLHNRLFWDGNENKWAIREGDYKLVKNKRGDIELYNLLDDVGESNNLFSTHTSIAKQLESNYMKWRSEMSEPMQRKKD